jgi:hypothetical protein
MNGSSCSATEALGDQGKLGGSYPPFLCDRKAPIRLGEGRLHRVLAARSLCPAAAPCRWEQIARE